MVSALARKLRGLLVAVVTVPTCRIRRETARRRGSADDHFVVHHHRLRRAAAGAEPLGEAFGQAPRPVAGPRAGRGPHGSVVELSALVVYPFGSNHIEQRLANHAVF